MNNLPLLSNTSLECQKLEPTQNQQASIPRSTNTRKKKEVIMGSLLNDIKKYSATVL